jgi:hypothetical protein
MPIDATAESPKTAITRSRVHNTLRYGLVAALCVLSFAGETTKQVLHTAGRFHLAGHVFAFSVIEYLFVTDARTTRARLAWTALLIVFGCSIEFAQHLVFKQPPEFIDMAADSLGCLLGLMVCVAQSRKRDR